MQSFLRRSRSSHSFFLLRWTFILCSVSFALLLQSPSAKGREMADSEDEFAEFDFDEEEFEVRKPETKGKKEDSKKVEAEQAAEDDEDDFDEEEEEEEVRAQAPKRRAPREDDEGDEAVVEEEEEDEFAHFEDEEEFEGYRRDDGNANEARGKPRAPPPKTINITKVPAHLSNNWENYLLEILMAAGIVVYFLNFFTGKSKNHRIATSWFNAHKALLESNFSLVGDDGAKDVDDVETQLVKEAEHVFTLWCSGRVCCEGMLIELRLLKRQDLVSVISNLMKPSQDQVQVRVNMNADDMDTFVFCLATKKAAARLSKEVSDINTFCPEKRPADKYGAPAHFCLMSEIAEVSAAMLDSKMTAILNKYPDAVESIHFSDQYTGPKPSDDAIVSDLPEGKKVLIFTFNINLKKTTVEEAVENMKPLMLLVFYFMDKVKRYRLTREAKNKAEKNRSKVAEAFWKSIHASRAEKAQEERERKRREIKERIKEIEDPDKQKKLEDRELRREKKKAQPKMKQLKVKAM